MSSGTARPQDLGVRWARATGNPWEISGLCCETYETRWQRQLRMLSFRFFMMLGSVARRVWHRHRHVLQILWNTMTVWIIGIPMIGFTTRQPFCFWMESSNDPPQYWELTGGLRIRHWSNTARSAVPSSFGMSSFQPWHHGRYDKSEVPNTPPEASPFWPFSNLGWRTWWGRGAKWQPMSLAGYEDVSRTVLRGWTSTRPIWLAALWLSSLSHPPSRKLVQQTKTARHNDRHGPDSLRGNLSLRVWVYSSSMNRSPNGSQERAELTKARDSHSWNEVFGSDLWAETG